MESLFKGRREDNGKWIEGYLLKDLLKTHIITEEAIKRMIEPLMAYTSYKVSVELVNVLPASVSQYIGKTDDRGTKIFNRDVISVKHNGKEEYRFVVEYGICKGYIGFYFAAANEETKKCLEQGLRNDICFWLDDEAYYCEVVGHLDSEQLEEPTHIEQPCKIGDTVYQIDAERVYESKIKNIIYDTDNIAFDKTAIGTSVFLSKVEAEKRLQRAGECAGCCCGDGAECNKRNGGCMNYETKPIMG